jgi:hypothetical protein
MYDPAARDASDTLDGNPGDDPLDQGIAPPDRWSAGEGFGTTAEEQEEGESLDELLAEEEPETDPYAESETEAEDDDDRLYGFEPDPRAGRLVAEDEGAHPDAEDELVAEDVGIDAGAASAEEAAVHEEDEEEEEG